VLIVLMRHGSAERGGRDADRPLAPAGRAQAVQAARALARLGVQPAHVLTSPARRCRQTAELVTGALAVTAERLHVHDGLAVGAGLERSLAALEAEVDPGAGSACLVVGHQPDLEALARRLLGAASLFLFLPPGGLLALELFEDDFAAPAALRWLLPPEALADAASRQAP